MFIKSPVYKNEIMKSNVYANNEIKCVCRFFEVMESQEEIDRSVLFIKISHD